MHELSIVESIIQIAEENTEPKESSVIERIELEIGSLAGIEMSAFEFAWKSAVPDTVLEGAEKVIHHVFAKAKCSECNFEFEVEAVYDPCPDCGNYFTEIIEGKDLKVLSLTLNNSKT